MQARTPALAEIIGAPNWFPDNVDFSRNTFGFVQTTREALSQQSFLDARWNRTPLARVDVQIPTILSAVETLPRPKLNFIWHTAFCCSTLIARCLDVEGENLALKEPQILILLAEAKRAGTQRGSAAEAAFKLLARRHQPREQVLIKPTNAVNNLLPEATRATDGRMLFLYSDCKSFLISIAKKGEMGRIFARKLFGLFAADGHAPAKWPMQTLFELSDLQVAALVWHMQIAEFRRSRDTARAAALNCDTFLANPHETLSRLNTFFDLNLAAAQLDAIASGPHLSRDAKDATQSFSAERRAAEAGDIAKSLGNELDIVVEWSFRACPETPRENPLGPTL
ncbi:MAG TPA: hypothetical protein VGM36_16010 [Rhizomicrobium sp.]|jgi:hypothetical protein